MNAPKRENDPPRYVPHRALPPYSYVTGRWPHPVRDPAGHSHAAEEPPAALPSPAAWAECEAYVWGVELFNHGYYWEAHESWEAVWHAVGRRGTTASFLKGLIKLAAAGVKAREGRAEGVRRHAHGAQELLGEVAQELESAGSPSPSLTYMGLQLNELIAAARELEANPEAILGDREAAVVVVMPFWLRLGGDDAKHESE